MFKASKQATIRTYIKLSVKVIFPILVITLFYLLRVAYLDNQVDLLMYSFVPVFVVLLSLVGGSIAGITTTLYSTILGAFIYLDDKLLNLSSLDFNRILTNVITGVIISLLVGIFTNTQKRLQKTSKDLSTHTERLRNVIDSVFTIIVIIDKDGLVIEANKAYAEYLPEDWDEINNKSIFSLSPWVDDISITYRLKDAIKQVTITDPVKYEDIIKLDGKLIYAEINVVLIEEFPDKEIVITVRDRTDRKLYEDEINKRNLIFEKLIDSNVVGMIIGNDKGLIIESNDAFLNMIGYTPEEFNLGIRCLDITPPEYYKKDHQIIETILTNGSAPPIEKEFIHKNGNKIPVLLSGIKISDNDDSILCIIIDLTIQKELQKKKDEFISIASHELKTPMTIIKGYLQILGKKINKKEDESSFLSIIDSQLNKLNTLVNELHDISKIEADKLNMNFEIFNLKDLINTSIKEIEPFIDNQTISFKSDEGEIFVKADKFRIEQVIVNLLTNAIKFSNPEGEILVRLKRIKNGLALIEVEDFGIGISQEDLKKLFTKFFQVEKDKELKEGLGLGLYISSEIISKHKGEIRVKSRLGKGSIFSFTLPLAN